MLLSSISVCVFLWPCEFLHGCVLLGGKASDKWCSFGPGELTTNTGFIFSTQEEKHVCITCMCICVCVSWGLGGYRVEEKKTDN